LVVAAVLVIALGASGVAVASQSSGEIGASSTTASDAQVFVAMSPLRVLDTRPQFGPIGVPVGKPLGPGQVLNLRFKGPGKPLPAEAVAAVLNVTIDQDATKKSFMTVWPEGESRPNASVNNAEPGFIAANSMIAKLGNNGGVNIYNDEGFVNLAIDLVGYTIPVSEVSGLGGSKFLVGSGAPSAGTGANGDLYLDSSSKKLYGPKSSGTWGAPVADLSGGAAGPAGSSFLTGAGAPGPSAGNDGDSYLDTTTGTVFQRTSGAWSPISGSLKGPKGDPGDPGPGTETSDTTPAGACSPNGLLHLNTATGEVVVCQSGTWSGVIALKNAVSGATFYADSGGAPTAIDLDSGSWTTVASFTAPTGGTYVLDGNVTASQHAIVLVSALATVQCAWFDSTGTTQLGPVSSQSTVAQLSLLTSASAVNLGAKAKVNLASASNADLRCRFGGVTLGLGGFRSTGWSYEATRTS
jgi:hypothetical protein